MYRTSYLIDGIILQDVAIHKDLGVTVDGQLSCQHHLNYIIAKANIRMGFVKRNTNDFTNLRTFTTLYCALVRPILEYAASIWNPKYDCNIRRLERVQIKFIKFICYKIGVEYHSYMYNYLLLYLGLNSLQTRRVMTDVLFGYRILRAAINCAELLSYFKIHVPSINTRSKSELSVDMHRTNYSCNSVINRIKTAINQVAFRVNIYEPSYKKFKYDLMRSL